MKIYTFKGGLINNGNGKKYRAFNVHIWKLQFQFVITFLIGNGDDGTRTTGN